MSNKKLADPQPESLLRLVGRLKIAEAKMRILTADDLEINIKLRSKKNGSDYLEMEFCDEIHLENTSYQKIYDQLINEVKAEVLHCHKGIKRINDDIKALPWSTKESLKEINDQFPSPKYGLL